MTENPERMLPRCTSLRRATDGVKSLMLQRKIRIGFLMPSKLIFDGMGLRYSHNQGEFLNGNNTIQCFAANVYFNSKSYLIAKRDAFIQFLRENNLQIVWTVLGEKQIIGRRAFGLAYPGRLEISGTYYFQDNEVTGTLHTKIKH